MIIEPVSCVRLADKTAHNWSTKNFYSQSSQERCKRFKEKLISLNWSRAYLR